MEFACRFHIFVLYLYQQNETIMSRFEVKKMTGVKVKSSNKLFGVESYYEPTGWGCFDTERNEFVCLSFDVPFSTYQKKSTMAEVVRQFNVYGATCGNDNLKLIKRF